jgi:hypothetical protein
MRGVDLLEIANAVDAGGKGRRIAERVNTAACGAGT